MLTYGTLGPEPEPLDLLYISGRQVALPLHKRSENENAEAMKQAKSAMRKASVQNEGMEFKVLCLCNLLMRIMTSLRLQVLFERRV